MADATWSKPSVRRPLQLDHTIQGVRCGQRRRSRGGDMVASMRATRSRPAGRLSWLPFGDAGSHAQQVLHQELRPQHHRFGNGARRPQSLRRRASGSAPTARPANMCGYLHNSRHTGPSGPVGEEGIEDRLLRARLGQKEGPADALKRHVDCPLVAEIPDDHLHSLPHLRQLPGLSGEDFDRQVVEVRQRARIRSPVAPVTSSIYKPLKRSDPCTVPISTN